MGTTTETADYQRIEAEIACDTSPVGIDAKKTHVLILSKLESIERRLDRLERVKPAPAAGLPTTIEHTLKNTLATTTDTIDDTIARHGFRAMGSPCDLSGTPW